MAKWKIKVPGSTANLGPGFDSIGLAINRYLTIEATPDDRWRFTYSNREYQDLPTDEDNLIYKAVKHTAIYKGITDSLPGCHVTIHSDLPLARGLGSSAAAIVAGIELANVLLDLSLSQSEKVRIGSLFEGHPDNIGASICGGLTVASHIENDETFIIPCGSPKMALAIMVPPNQLLTSLSRGVLPRDLSFKKAVKGSSVANVMVAALLKGDYNMVGQMMSRDVFHEPYRSSLIPDLDKIKKLVRLNDNVYGASLSGGGPSIMLYLKQETSHRTVKELKLSFSNYSIDLLQIEREGSTVIQSNLIND